MRGLVVALAGILVAAGCSGDGGESASAGGDDASVDDPAGQGAEGAEPAQGVEPAQGAEPAVGAEPAESADDDELTGESGLLTSEGFELPPRPDIPDGPTSPDLLAALDRLFAAIDVNEYQAEDVHALGDLGDLRVGWVLADLMRFVVSPLGATDIAGAFFRLTGVDLLDRNAASQTWKSLNDHLMGWDVPAFAEYPRYKERLFARVEPGWAPFFADPDATIDWRFVTWGGVFIDDRPLGETVGCPRGCIPSLDDPPMTPAAEGDWYPDDAIVFGVDVDGDVRAFPKNIMEVHEMVNATIGGRRIGMPYCTLCGSAQLYFTDSVPDGVGTPVLRTSGLLTRSNKMMYDLLSDSVFDTFTGEARSGPLRESGVVLEQGTVITTTWAEWKRAHPDTTIVARDGGLGRSYELDPLRGRDDDGPIFPIGDVDQRLAVQEPVVGVIAPDGSPVAFPAGTARLTLEAGGDVAAAGVTLELDGGGLRAADDDGNELAAHQSFWFAWSQFHADTLLWGPG